MQIGKIVFCFAFIAVITSCGTTKRLPGQNEVLAAMEKANAYFMSKWPDPGKDIFVPSKNRTWPSHIWTRAVYYEGLMALYSVDRKKEYYDYAVDWADKHNWSLRDGIKTRNGDNQACGQTYIDLYLLDKKEQRIKDIRSSIDSMMASDKIDDWNWIDALQMTRIIFIACMKCMPSPNTNMVTMACLMLQLDCGGEIKILIHRTKNPMGKIVIGAAAMVG
jgi:unsaturated rhamnogalacturonyl hydrolase